MVTGTSVTSIIFSGAGTCSTNATIAIAAPSGTNTGTASATALCTAAPTLVIAPPTGTVTGKTATVHPVLSASGRVVSIEIDDGGTGYNPTGATPLVTVDSGSCTPATNFKSTIDATGKVSAVNIISMGGASATVTRSGNTLSFNITSQGSGYTTAPAVTLGGLT